MIGNMSAHLICKSHSTLCYSIKYGVTQHFNQGSCFFVFCCQLCSRPLCCTVEICFVLPTKLTPPTLRLPYWAPIATMEWLPRKPACSSNHIWHKEEEEERREEERSAALSLRHAQREEGVRERMCVRNLPPKSSRRKRETERGERGKQQRWIPDALQHTNTNTSHLSCFFTETQSALLLFLSTFGPKHWKNCCPFLLQPETINGHSFPVGTKRLLHISWTAEKTHLISERLFSNQKKKKHTLNFLLNLIHTHKINI